MDDLKQKYEQLLERYDKVLTAVKELQEKVGLIGGKASAI